MTTDTTTTTAIPMVSDDPLSSTTTSCHVEVQADLLKSILLCLQEFAMVVEFHFHPEHGLSFGIQDNNQECLVEGIISPDNFDWYVIDRPITCTVFVSSILNEYFIKYVSQTKKTIIILFLEKNPPYIESMNIHTKQIAPVYQLSQSVKPLEFIVHSLGSDMSIRPQDHLRPCLDTDYASTLVSIHPLNFQQIMSLGFIDNVSIHFEIHADATLIAYTESIGAGYICIQGTLVNDKTILTDQGFSNNGGEPQSSSLCQVQERKDGFTGGIPPRTDDGKDPFCETIVANIPDRSIMTLTPTRLNKTTTPVSHTICFQRSILHAINVKLGSSHVLVGLNDKYGLVVSFPIFGFGVSRVDVNHIYHKPSFLRFRSKPIYHTVTSSSPL